MRMLAAFAIVAATGGVASAEPILGFGLAYGVGDTQAPAQHEIGPMVSLTERLGAFSGVFDYTYLSFLDMDTTASGVHRLSASLRFDVYRARRNRCTIGLACTREHSMYVDAGVGERIGRWYLDYNHRSPGPDPHPEAHVGLGFEFDSAVHPRRMGGQLGIRLAFSPHDATEVPSCRSSPGTTCGTSSTGGGGIDRAIFIEWTFLIGL